MFSYNHVRLWEAGSGEQGVLIPLDAMLPTQTSPADSSLPFNNSTSLTDVIDASTGTVWAPSLRTMILHVITGCCGSIWEIIPTPCLDGPSAHVQGRFVPRTLSQSWRGLHHLLPLACWVCFGQPGEFSSTEPSRCCSLTATLEKLSYPFLESRTQEDLNESVLLKEL